SITTRISAPAHARLHAETGRFRVGGGELEKRNFAAGGDFLDGGKQRQNLLERNGIEFEFHGAGNRAQRQNFVFQTELPGRFLDDGHERRRSAGRHPFFRRAGKEPRHPFELQRFPLLQRQLLAQAGHVVSRRQRHKQKEKNRQQQEPAVFHQLI